MKIQQLKIHKHRLLHLAQIETIEFNPISKTQVLLGTNGSGKSVLLQEHSPLPADKDFYEPNGYKYIEIIHNNSQYRLKSSFADSNTYSFIKDEVELNPSLKITTFKDLVYQEFGITKEIHDLMIGRVHFDQLDVKQRKEWITRISQIDYDYAFAYYKKLVERTRDLQGAIKNLNVKLLQEKQKEISQEEMKRTDELLRYLYQEVSRLRDQKSLPKLTRSQLDQAKKQLSDKINDLIKQLLTTEKQLADKQELLTDIHQTKAKLESQETSLKSVIGEHQKEIEKSLKELEDLQSYMTDNKDILSIEKTTLLEILEKKKSELIYLKDCTVDNAVVARELLASKVDDLDVMLQDMDDQSETSISQAYLIEVRAKEDSSSAQIKGIDSVVAVYQKEIHELTKHEHEDPVTCPQCSHKWNPHFDQDLLKNRQDLIASLMSKKETLKKQYEDNYEKRIYIEEERRKRKAFSAYAENYPQLKWYWNLYAKHKWLRTPKAACHYTYEILKELLILIEVEKLEDNLKKKEELETLNTKVMQEKIAYLEKQIQDKNTICHEKWLELTEVKSRALQINLLVKSLNNYDQLRKKVIDYEKENKLYVEMDLTHLTNEHLSECIEILQKEIQVHEQKQLKAKNTAHVVSLLEEELSSLEKKQELLKYACTELSPNKGLIAKGLKGFLDHFLPQVNSFIEQVWLYPMKVCVKESTEKGIELDYKFQVQVNDAKPADDISNVSKGMKEMINLAFRLASMPYLGLENSCVYLDEYGANLDNKHKLAAYRVVKSLMESENYSQVYVVSHFADGYEVLDNADFTVLCGSNIEMPTKNINETTLITYR